MKKLILIITVVAAACVFNACRSGGGVAETTELPVITGVKSNITVYEDDSDEFIANALAEGVFTEGGKSFEVKIRILSLVDESEVTVLTAGQYSLRYYCDDPAIEVVKSSLTVKPADKTAPEFSGVKDIAVYIGDTVSYRDGVTVTDNDDKNVRFSVDATKVDLTRLGRYEVTYTATDKRGNTATATATVSVLEPLDDGGEQGSSVCTKEELDALCSSILKSILKDGMTDREKAEAIYNKVYKVKYVSTDDDPNWIVNAWTALTTNKGDCVNYSAASRALLTMAGIPNYQIERVGGTTDHYWLIVCIDEKWYHFDTCPTSKKYPFKCFLKTDSEVKAYSDSRTDKPNYYGYDKENCPYDVVD